MNLLNTLVAAAALAVQPPSADPNIENKAPAPVTEVQTEAQKKTTNLIGPPVEPEGTPTEKPKEDSPYRYPTSVKPPSAERVRTFRLPNGNRVQIQPTQASQEQGPGSQVQ